MRKKIIFTAGGTGGHIFPALAVAKLCQDEYDVLWVGSRLGIENKIVPDAGVGYKSINMVAFRQKGLKRKLLMPFILLRAFLEILWILVTERPDAVVGFGGYITFPVCLIARVLQIPVIIHEQNSVAGLTNKVLAKIASKVLVGFKGVLASRKTILVGNPVRDEIIRIEEPKNRYARRSGGLNIAIVGGSLGAKVFNDKLPAVFAKVSKENPLLINKIVHQVGRDNRQEVEAVYRGAGLFNVEVVNFITDMAALYSDTDLLICRSGASTVSEICASGVAALFVPYPYAVDDHQHYNAKPLVAIDAAYMLLQHELTTETVANLLLNVTRTTCAEMACKSKSLAIPDSTLQIKKIIVSLIK